MNSTIGGGNGSQSTPVANKQKVLKLIRNSVQITRADIIDKTGLSAPTISRIIDGLLKSGLIIQEEVGESSGGRPPQIIRFNSKNNYVIGLDIGGTTLKAVFSNLDGEFIYEIEHQLGDNREFASVMEESGELINRLILRAEVEGGQIHGIGVAVIGIVNKKSGELVYSPVLGWKNVDIKKALSQYVDLKIRIGNVANLIALGELYYGIGARLNNFICLNLEYGIGSGIIIDRKPFYGANGYSGEIGHVVVEPGSKRIGKDGISGTLEALSSNYSILEFVAEQLRKGVESSLIGEVLSIKKIFKAAEDGDPLAMDVIENAATYIGYSIDTLVKIFDTQAVVLSGGAGSESVYFIDSIRNKVNSLSLPLYKNAIPIVDSSFGKEASLMGAFSLILEDILQNYTG